jgi:hypothetical protein
LSLDALIGFVREWRTACPQGTKDSLVTELTRKFALTKRGALLVGDAFAVRVSQNSADTGFPNAVVAFKKIVENDNRPVVVCLLTPRRCNLYLANTTFLRKVSHSSHGLTKEKLVGSILGSDILAEYEGIGNVSENLPALWDRHQRADRAAHQARIIAATHGIGVSAVTWIPSSQETDRILASPELARGISGTPEYAQLATRLNTAIQQQRAAILAAARNPNAKRRGDCIEEIVTGAAKNQGLGDLTVQILATTISIDVKSKRLDLSSAPKAYNVDKVLRYLSQGSRLLAILFIGVDPSREVLTTRVVSVFDRTLVAASRIDVRWSGRGTRGTVQFSGDIDAIWNEDFVEAIEIEEAKQFLWKLISA